MWKARSQAQCAPLWAPFPGGGGTGEAKHMNPSGLGAEVCNWHSAHSLIQQTLLSAYLPGSMGNMTYLPPGAWWGDSHVEKGEGNSLTARLRAEQEQVTVLGSRATVTASFGAGL